MAKTIPLVPALNVLDQDPITNLVLLGEITGTLPTGGTFANIFAKSCILEKTDTGVDYFMSGTVAVPAWSVVTTGSAITSLTGDVTAAGPGAAAATIASGAVSVSKLASNAVTTVKILDANVTTPKIADANVTLAKLATGIAPSHIVKFAGKHTTTGGSATEAFTVAGVAATDIVIATIQREGGTPQTLLSSAPTTNTITLIFSGDPSTDHIVSYQVLRAAA